MPTSSVELDPLNLANAEPIVLDGEIQEARIFGIGGNPPLINTRLTVAVSRVFHGQESLAGTGVIQFPLGGGAWLDSLGTCWVDPREAAELHIGEHILILSSAAAIEKHEVPTYLIAPSTNGATEILGWSFNGFRPYRRYSLSQVEQIIDDSISWQQAHPACKDTGERTILLSTSRIALPDRSFHFDAGFPDGEGYAPHLVEGRTVRHAQVEATVLQISTFLPHQMGAHPIDTYEPPMPVFRHVELRVSAVIMGQDWLGNSLGTIAVDTPGGMATDDWNRCEEQMDGGLFLHPGERVTVVLYMRTDGHKFWAPTWAWRDLDTGHNLLDQFPWTAIRP